jgi:hypothetical protein
MTPAARPAPGSRDRKRRNLVELLTPKPERFVVVERREQDEGVGQSSLVSTLNLHFVLLRLVLRPLGDG